MGGNGEGDRTERGMETEERQRGPAEERDCVFVSQVSRAVHGHGDRPASLT